MPLFNVMRIDLGAGTRKDQLRFSIPVDNTEKEFEALIPGCPCTQAQYDPQREVIDGLVDLGLAVPKGSTGVSQKTLRVTEKDGVAIYIPDESGNIGLNPDKKIYTINLKFTVLPDK